MSSDITPAPLSQFPKLGALPRIVNAVTTRFGPAFGKVGTDKATAEAAEETARLLDMDATAWVHQVHGDTILQADRPGIAGQADGLVTDCPGLLIAGRSADCPIILVAGQRETSEPVVGFVHASWRSTVQGITSQLIRRLTEEMNVLPESLHAAIAPSAGPCCYEVGPEVREEALQKLGPVAADFFIPTNERWIFDLWAANQRQLHDGGVPDHQVENSRICTICQGGAFWSWRDQGEQAGRFAGVIGIRKSTDNS